MIKFINIEFKSERISDSIFLVNEKLIYSSIAINNIRITCTFNSIYSYGYIKGECSITTNSSACGLE